MTLHKSGNPGERDARRGELFITRTLYASRETVWKAWTDPGLVQRWWGPKGFSSPFCTIDLRVGGRYLYCMRSPEGKDYWSTGIYREIIVPERVVCTDSFSDENGKVVPASYYGMGEGWPLELLVTVTFEEQGCTTIVTLRHAGFPSDEMRDLAGAGWNESLDKLAASFKP